MEKYITISEKDFNELQTKSDALDLNKTIIDIYYNGFRNDRKIEIVLNDNESLSEVRKQEIKEVLRELKEFSDTLTELDKDVLHYLTQNLENDLKSLQNEHNKLIKEHEALKKVPKWILWFFKN